MPAAPYHADTSKDEQCECAGNHNSKEALRKLTEDFANANHQSCGLSSATAELPQRAPRWWAGSYADRHCQCTPAEAVAQALADSVLAAERAATRHPGLSQVSCPAADACHEMRRSELAIWHAQA